MKEKKYEEVYDKWLSLNTQLRDECLDFIRKTLKKVGNGVVLDDDHPVCISYDGGNHPETESNCFSEVSCVYLKGDAIYVDTEDAIGYALADVTAAEIHDVACALDGQVEQGYDFDDDEE